MNLGKKKSLAARTLKVGKERIIFVNSRLDEIKEAITKQDIRDLHKNNSIIIRSIRGRKKIVRKKTRRSVGNIRKKVKGKKREYIIFTRMFRRLLKETINQDSISNEKIKDVRNKIRNRFFKSKSHFKSYLTELSRGKIK